MADDGIIVIDLDTLLLLSLVGSMNERDMLGSLLLTTIASRGCWSMSLTVAGGKPSDLFTVIDSAMAEFSRSADGPTPLQKIRYEM